MPFANLGGNPEQDYFSHGITMEVHSDLTRFRDLFVSGRSSCLNIDALTTDITEISQKLGVQYLVRGGVRSDGKRLRINAELVDSESGSTLWSERYDRPMEDIFDIEVEVANTIAATLKIRLEDALYERSRERSAERLSAYDWILRGNRSLELGGSDNWDNAKQEFGRALELNPDSSTASAGLSITYAYECCELAARDYKESLDLHQATLHAKMLVFDRSKVFVGSLNLDPRSWNINTEMGVLIRSTSYAEKLIASSEERRPDSYRLYLDDKQRVRWRGAGGEGQRYRREPETSAWLRLKVWLAGLLPLESQL